MKYVHVIRNPYDNISTMYRRATEERPESELRSSIDSYFSLCETVADLRTQIGGTDWFELRHESFIDSPKTHLAGLCRFLGVTASSGYLEDCADVVFESPHRSRFETGWNQALIHLVEQGIERFQYLHGYSYES